MHPENDSLISAVMVSLDHGFYILVTLINSHAYFRILLLLLGERIMQISLKDLGLKYGYI